MHPEDKDQDQSLELMPIKAEPLSVAGATTVAVTDASAKGLALMRLRVENQKEMFRLALSLTTPNQWTVFSGRDRDGNLKESVYPTGGAADTIIRRAFGLIWGPKEVVVEESADGPVAICKAWLTHGGEQVEQFEGRRYMGGFVQNEASLRKGAVENMKSGAVRDLLGLRFRTPAELKDMGLDLGKLPSRAEFQSHQKQDGELRAPFGKQKGASIPDLTDDNLDWLAKVIGESASDPSKARFKKKNVELLNALKTEQAKRANGGGQDPAEAPIDEEQQSFDDVGPKDWNDDGAAY